MGKPQVPVGRTKEDPSDLWEKGQCYLFNSFEEVKRGAAPRTIKILSEHGQRLKDGSFFFF